MVSTRGHPKEFPEPDLSPSRTILSRSTPSRNRKTSGAWVHTPTTFTLIWLLISIPLVIWDTGYVLLRPLSMPGGALHWPLWVPYELYTRTDYIYGWKAFNEKNGFTSAQATLNVIETLFYFYYMYLVYAQGTQWTARGVGKGKSKLGFLSQRRVAGQAGAMAAAVGFAAAIMTASKTLLYGLNEAYSGWSNVGHNKVINLLFLWIIPNGAWLVAGAYMSVAFGSEILEGLSVAAGDPLPEDTSLLKGE